MDEIGVRDLKATLSSVLRQVSEGRHVRVTARGRPVADLLPPGAAGPGDALRALVVAGRVTEASRARPERPPQLARPQRSASELVLADRESER